MLLFLSKSGRQFSLIVTISVAVCLIAKVLNDFVSSSVFGTAPFGKAGILIKNPIEPESKITQSSLLLRTYTFLFAVQIITGVSFLGAENFGSL